MTNTAIIITQVLSYTALFTSFSTTIAEFFHQNRKNEFKAQNTKFKNSKKQMISVLVYAQNAEPYIIENLNSILKNKYKKKEIIVLDNGSTDKTASLVRVYIKNHQNQFIRLVQKRKFSDSTVAITQAVKKHAAGELVLFLDGKQSIRQTTLYDISLIFYLKSSTSFILLRSGFKNTKDLKELVNNQIRFTSSRRNMLLQMLRLPHKITTNSFAARKLVYSSALVTKNHCNVANSSANSTNLQKLSFFYLNKISYDESPNINSTNNFLNENLPIKNQISYISECVNSNRNFISSSIERILSLLTYSEQYMYALFIFASLILKDPAVFLIGWMLYMALFLTTVLVSDSTTVKDKLLVLRHLAVTYTFAIAVNLASWVKNIFTCVFHFRRKAVGV